MNEYFVYTKAGDQLTVKASSWSADKESLTFNNDKGMKIALFNLDAIIGFILKDNEVARSLDELRSLPAGR